jgi:opacity protein-like surface antigen
MKRVIVVLGIIGMVFCMVPSSAFAAGSYVGLKLSNFTPNSDDYDGFDSTIGFELDYGNRISSSSAFEVGLLYQAPELKSAYSEDSVTLTDTTVTTIGIPFTFKGILPIADNKAELYLGGGFGIYYSTMDIKGRVGSGYYGTSVSTSESGIGYGIHLVGGADAIVTSNLAVGAEIKWDYQPTTFSDVYYSTTTNLGGLTFSLTSKYKF